MHRNIPRFLNRLLGLPLDTQVTPCKQLRCLLPQGIYIAVLQGVMTSWTSKGLHAPSCSSLQLCLHLQQHFVRCGYTHLGSAALHLDQACGHHWSDALQECMFAYFSSTLDAVITAAKSRGDFDNGIVTLKGMTSIELMHQDVVHKDRFSGANCGLFW